jgi:DNA-binding CsgD family transcriptional regulator
MGRARQAVREEIRRASRTATDPIALHRSVADALPTAVPFDRWCGLLLDPATLMATSGYHEEGLPMQVLPRLLELEAADSDVNGMTALARTRNGVSTIDRATEGDPPRSERYRDVLEPSGLGRELRAVLRERRSGWGGFVLLRETASPDFTDDEMEFVAAITEDVARGIRRCLLRSEMVNRDDDSVPGMLVVGAGGFEPEVVTAAASAWLAAIDERANPGSLPQAATSVVARARSAPADVARARLRLADGRWLTLYAEALDEGPQARVSVVLEPTRPYELAAIMCEAYLLTPRERDIAQQVLLGRSTQEIASALFLSAWTVQDHLKKVFDKVGVRSRSELAARLFFGHYEPRITSGAPLGADGWFIDEPRPRGSR